MNRNGTMCSFIILLLLLCKNGGNCGCNMNGCACVEDICGNRGNSCRWDNEDWRRGTDECRRDKDDDCRRDKDDDCRRNKDDDCRRNERECGCSACEESCSDASPVMEREDIWTSYRNTSSGRQMK